MAALPRSAMNLRHLMQNCASRTKPARGGVVHHSKNLPPMAEMGQDQ